MSFTTLNKSEVINRIKENSAKTELSCTPILYQQVLDIVNSAWKKLRKIKDNGYSSPNFWLEWHTVKFINRLWDKKMWNQFFVNEEKFNVTLKNWDNVTVCWELHTIYKKTNDWIYLLVDLWSPDGWNPKDTPVLIKPTAQSSLANKKWAHWLGSPNWSRMLIGNSEIIPTFDTAFPDDWTKNKQKLNYFWLYKVNGDEKWLNENEIEWDHHWVKLDDLVELNLERLVSHNLQKTLNMFMSKNVLDS